MAADDIERLRGIALGAVGVLVFSFTFPATKLALDGFSPWFIAFGRAALAAVFAGGTLAALRVPRPSRRQAARLAVTAGGVVVGFPLLSSLALETAGSAHGRDRDRVAAGCDGRRGGRARGRAAGGSRSGSRPRPASRSSPRSPSASRGGISLADGYLLLAVVVCGIGYAEGGALARELGALETICWALVLSLPVTLVVVPLTVPASLPPANVIFGFAYSGIGSMFLGFVAWYAGLARGGVARVGQLQLFQPLLTVGWSALVLGESIGWDVVGAGIGVVACVARRPAGARPSGGERG